VGLAIAIAGCSSDDASSPASEATVSSPEATTDGAPDTAATTPSTGGGGTSVATDATDATGATDDAGEVAGGEFFDTTAVHSIEVTFDQTAYDAMIATYEDSGDKDWIEATVVIDGTTFERAGLRLKGNSSLGGLRGDGPGGGRGPMSDASADEPEGLPWLVRLDKFVDDQEFAGVSEFVVRSNNSESALNEAVAVSLIADAGMLSQRATYVRFTVNDRPTALRLVLENMEQTWADDNLPDDALLYKADASGDYSYRGDDPAAYDEAWGQEAGDDDLQPLIDFLDFVNNSDDDTFAAEIGDHLDLDAFAEYMAMEDLLQNFDDISGPGNNSFLAYDPATRRMTVVAWDHNLALSNMRGPGGGQGGGQGGPPGGFDPTQAPDGTLPDGATLPAGGQGPGGGPGGFAKANTLVDRLADLDEYTSRYDAAMAELRAQLIDSGTAQQVLDEWTQLLVDQAGDLVSADTIRSESAAIAAILTGD
jgi:spore coat protein CotH